MDEIIDVLDEKNGEKTGEIISKKEAHKTGIWHGAIHILIVDKEHNRTLLQKRCEQKPLYPNTWDIAVGGHISAGESDFIAAKREFEEELGLNPSNYEIKFIEKIKEKLNNNGIISNEYVSIFVIYADVDINSVVLQEEEVSEIKWCSKEELNDFIEMQIIIPHVNENKILNEILN